MQTEKQTKRKASPQQEKKGCEELSTDQVNVSKNNCIVYLRARRNKTFS